MTPEQIRAYIRSVNPPEESRWQRMDSAIATLRHAYAQLATGRVVDQKAFAEGLIGRAIRELEKINNENT